MNIRFAIQTIMYVTVATSSMTNAALASECEGILGYIQDKTSSTISGKNYSSYERFFCSDEYSSYSQARDAGVKVGVPVDGIPAEFGGHNRESNWSSYRKALCESIRTSNFSTNDLQLTINKGNEAAIAAWKACVTSPGMHFYAESHSPDDMQFVLVAKYNPDGAVNSTLANGPVTFQPPGSVECTGDEIKDGTTINPGSRLLNCSRKTESATTITLSTGNGPGIVRLPAKLGSPPSPHCPLLQTKIFFETSNKALDDARVEVNVDTDYKIVGGGARVNWKGAGNLLTASYPENQQKWVAMSKAHSVSDPATITAWAIAIYDPNDEWEVAYKSATGSSGPTLQKSRATLPDGYAMTGGGARVNSSGAGNLLTASYPVDSMTWEALSKDHSVISHASITAYVIGVKPHHQCVGKIDSKISSSMSDPAQTPKVRAELPSGFVLTGGGAMVDWSGGAGNLLTASYPVNESAWEAQSKDHSVISPASITVYSIGIHP